jgi:hypothetical protein
MGIRLKTTALSRRRQIAAFESVICSSLAL